MSILINGSICFTDLMDKAKAGHSAFSRGKNGKAYVSITQWLNDDADQYGNHLSIQLNSTKEKREAEGKVYIGNGKVSGPQSAAHPTSQQVAAPVMAAADDLPF